jgi:hypothetical protein
MEYLFFLSGAGLATGLHGRYGAQKEGDRVWLMCRWECDTFYVHIHHWMWYGLALFIMLIYSPIQICFLQFFIYGWCLAGIIHGLQFEDWYCIYGSMK